MADLTGSCRRAATVIVAALALSAPAAAQRPAAIRLAADNDAFNFWMLPWDRPDQEYTSGVRGVLEYNGRLGWWPWQLITRDSAGTARTAGTVTHSFALGQEIYTGRANASPQSLALSAPVASRPNAGWLYLEAAQRDSSRRATSELSVAVGVTGTPSLGGEMQRFFHSIVAEYNRPVDWSRQLPFEPGFVVRYSRFDVLKPFGNGTRVHGAIRSELGGAIGSILTEGVVGASAGAEFGLGRLPGSDAPLSMVLTAGARTRAVLRDEFLDGTFFRTSESVPKKSVVFEQRVSIAFRWRQLSIAYRASRSSRQYTGQPRPASWGTLETEWRFGR